jgi:hypothetical protein
VIPVSKVIICWNWNWNGIFPQMLIKQDDNM